jgi:hypothetical protein
MPIAPATRPVAAIAGERPRRELGDIDGLARKKKRINLRWKRFGRLVVRDYAGGTKWVCICDCGAHRIVSGASLRGGKTRSCGCLARDVATKHGMSRSKEYNAWKSMKARCFNPRHQAYENYGGRGITVCEKYLPFEGWFPDVGLAPSPDHSLDRIDNDGNYAPGNVHWATRSEQTRNRRPPKQRKRRRSSLAEIQAYAASLARAASAPGGVRAAP